VATDVEPENVPRVGLSLLGRVGQLDPPGLPAAARENLGLDDHRATELRGGVRGFRGRRGGLSFGDGDAEVAKQLLPLVLVEIHAGRESTPVYPSDNIDKGGAMSVAKIVELTATGDSVENAVENGVAKASETLRNIQHVYVDALEAHCEDGRVTAYHVHLKLTFVVD
jgi:flavin-binding protein dodecin